MHCRCPSRVVNVIEPTPLEIENYMKEQIEKGEAENNDYLKYVITTGLRLTVQAPFVKMRNDNFFYFNRDDTWGPSPDLFRYEVVEVDSDELASPTAYVLDSIDVKREKAALTRDKCKFLLKLAMDFNEQKRKFVVKVNLCIRIFYK